MFKVNSLDTVLTEYLGILLTLYGTLRFYRSNLFIACNSSRLRFNLQIIHSKMPQVVICMTGATIHVIKAVKKLRDNVTHKTEYLT